MSRYDVTSGVTSTGIILNNYDSMYVLNGGTANSTTVNSGGYLWVSSGGVANSTTVNSDGVLVIRSGGVANSATVNSGGDLYVHSGGSANSIEVSSGGMMGVYGGSATNVDVFTSGEAQVYESGVFSGGNVFGSVTVSSGGWGIGLDIELLGNLTVFGRAAVCTVYSGGSVTVSSGGEIYSSYAKTGGTFEVNSGGTASINSGVVDDAVVFGGKMFVAHARVSRVFLYSAGALTAEAKSYISWGEISAGTLTLSSGGSAMSIYAHGDGSGIALAQLTVLHGATTSYGTIEGVDGRLNVDLGASAYNMCIESAGTATVSGTIESSTVSSGGCIRVFGPNSWADHIDVGSGGLLELNSGARAVGTSIGSGGSLYVKSGIAFSAYVSNGGQLLVNTKGSALHTFISQGGSAVVNTSGQILNASIESGGVMDVLSNGSVFGTHVSNGGQLKNSGGLLSNCYVSAGGTVVCRSGSVVLGQVSSGGDIVFSCGWIDNLTVSSGGRVRMAGHVDLTFSGGIVFSGGTMDFDISNHASAGESVLLGGFEAISDVGGNAIYTLTVNDTQKEGFYKLASYAARFIKTITVVNTEGTNLGTLSVGQTTNIGGVNYSLDLDRDEVLSVTIAGATPTPASKPAKFDVDGNGVSDVLFQYSGGDYQLGYWMNGTNEWRGNGLPHPAEWENLGCYDMTGDGKADSVLVGNVEVGGVKGAYIGYYADSDDADANWINIGYLTNAEDYVWKNKVGNLTGGSANSIIWYAPELYALGAWTDGTERWITISNNFGGDAWTLVGCGDFDGDGKDSVVMSYNGGQLFYAVGIDGASQSLGSSNWSGWDVRAIGDFKGDGKDDIVLFDQKSGSMVMCADGDIDSYVSLGQLDAADWFVVGAGDYDGDAKDDLLVRQKSTGMLGYYASGDMAQWNTLGYGVDMDWTVIA